MTATAIYNIGHAHGLAGYHPTDTYDSTATGRAAYDAGYTAGQKARRLRAAMS